MSAFLQSGSRGQDVAAWQQALVRSGLLSSPPDGIFGQRTKDATQRFQRNHALVPDGVVGPATWRAAEQEAHPVSAVAPAPAAVAAPTWPPKPPFHALAGQPGREQLFGRFTYEACPSAQEPDAIAVERAWVSDNITRVEVPQLGGIPYGWGGAANPHLFFHRKGALQLSALWTAWESAGLLPRILTFDGGYAPRFTRGCPGVLSPHAFGTAFDVNAAWNRLGRQPAPWQGKGSVLDLVAIANDHGFYWGGHFSRADGMHFEIAQLQ